MNNCKDDSIKDLPVIKNSLIKHLTYLGEAFERINDNSNSISLTQGKGSEDGFIDVIFGEVSKIIYDAPLIPIPRFDLTNVDSHNDYQNQQSMILQFIRITNDFKNRIVLVKDNDDLINSFNIFKTEFKKSYDGL